MTISFPRSGDYHPPHATPPHATSADHAKLGASSHGKAPIKPVHSFQDSLSTQQSTASGRYKRTAGEPSAQGTDRLSHPLLDGVFDGLLKETPPSPRQAAYDFAASYLKDHGIQGDPDQIFLTTHFPPSKSVPKGYDQQLMTMTDMVLRNRQAEFMDSSYGLVHTDLCGPDGKPVSGLDRADFQKHIWYDNFAQIYINRIEAYFQTNRDALIYSLRAGLSKSLTRQVIEGSLSSDGADIVSRGLGAGGYVDWNQRELSHFTHLKQDEGVVVRPLTINGAVSNQAVLFTEQATGRTVVYLPGNSSPFHAFGSQGEIADWFQKNVVEGGEKAREQFRSYFPDDTVKYVDQAYKNLAGHPERAHQGDYLQSQFGGGSLQGDTVTGMVDRLRQDYLTKGQENIVSDEQWGRKKAVEALDLLGMALMPLALIAPGMALALGVAIGAGQMGLGIHMNEHGNSQEQEEGRRLAVFGFLNAAQSAAEIVKVKVGAGKVLKEPDGSDIKTPGSGTKPRAPSELENRIQGVSDKGRVRPEHVVTDGNHITGIQVGGDAIFESQANLIKNAQHEVLIQTFAWDPSSPGARKILDGLMAIQTRPGTKVKVRLLVDESAGLAKKFMQLTSNNTGGGAGRWPSDPDALIGNFKRDPNFKYRPLLEKLDFEVRVHQHGGANAMHGKLVVVDNRYAATTGANVQGRNHGPNPAYDMGVTLEGPAAQGMRDAFVYNWNKSVNPDQKTSALPDAYEFPPRTEAAPAGKGQRISVVTRPPNANPLVKSVQNPQNQAFLGTIEGANREISIMTPNLNADDAIDALAKAADRGVKVRIIVSKEFNDARVGKPFGGGTNAQTIARLKAKTKHPENLDIRYFQNPGAPEGASVPSGNAAGNGASHAKLMIVDGKTAIVGSANMDNSSWYYAGELNLVIQSPDTAGQLNAMVFEPAWARSPSA